MRTEIAGRTCAFDCCGTGGPVIWWGIHEQENSEKTMELLRRGAGKRSYFLIAYPVKDWNREFSPWAAPSLQKQMEFEGGGRETLRWLREEAVPQVEKEYFQGKKQMHMLAGYSLAGLFSLWALCESTDFCGAACCSASLWYPGWEKYAAEHRAAKGSRIYLSLGTKEEKTRNPVMARVGEAVREQYRRLSRDPQVADCVLEWNAGGHFSNPEGRTARGILWLLSE